jgi:DNA helicase-2/ATP-dependent DNA helicase PcrA
VWETERPFELHLDGVTVSGRADVILDEEGGTPNALAILDYKTSTAGELDPYELQLQVYSAAGRREGLDVRAAFVHDLKGAARHTVDVSDQVIEEANKRVEKAAERIRDRDFRPSPGPICRSCEVRTVCPAAQI